jgi:hypothetical protein
MSSPQLGRDASGVPSADLSGLFGTPATAAVPDRTEGVPKLSPPPSRPADPIAPLQASSAPALSHAAAAPLGGPAAAAPARRAASRPRKASKRHPSSVVVYLSVTLRQRLRVNAGATSRSHTQIVFAALNDSHSRLGELAARSGQQPPEQPADGLFVVQQSGRRLHDEDQVQVSIRPNPANLAVIDQLAEQHTGGNRSALIALALDDYLPAG